MMQWPLYGHGVFLRMIFSITPASSFFGGVSEKGNYMFHQSCQSTHPQILSGIENSSAALDSHLDHPISQVPFPKLQFPSQGPTGTAEILCTTLESHWGRSKYTTIFLSPVLWTTQIRSFIQSYSGPKQRAAWTFMITFIPILSGDSCQALSRAFLTTFLWLRQHWVACELSTHTQV